MNTDLISISQTNAVEVLSSPDQVSKIIEEVKVKINTLDGGTLDTGVGRKKIITNANKAKKSKTAVCKYIDDLVLIKKVEIRDKTLEENETIRLLLQSKETLSSGLDEVYKETRQAVTEFEAKLKADKAEAAAKAKQDAIDAQGRADEAAEREEKQAILSEQNSLAQIEADKRRAEQNRISQIEAAQNSKRNAEIAAENARLAEVKRQQDINAKAAAEQAERDADKRHTAKVRRTAKDLLIARHGLSEEVAKAIIIDLHKRVFADITINY